MTSPIITGATADSVPIATKLDEARALIEKGWCQGEYRKGAKFCTLGAVAEVTARHYPTFNQALTALQSAVETNLPIWVWNDAPERTQSEVIEAFRKAADLARADAS